MNIEGQKVLYYVIDEGANIYVLYTSVTEYNVWYISETMDIAQLRVEMDNLRKKNMVNIYYSILVKVVK